MAYYERSGRNSWRVRYLRDDGSLGSKTGFTTEEAARNEARRITERRHGGTPTSEATTADQRFGTWIEPWFDSLDVAPATLAQYRSLVRNHIGPRWSAVPFNTISNLAAHTWAAELRAGGLADSTVKTIMKLITMMLADAADEGIISTTPIRPRRRGRRRPRRKPDVVWATPEQALLVALQAGDLVGEWAAVVIVSAAWTGARWGELTGLQRGNIHLDDGCFVIDPDTGALHEVGGTLQLGPPKTDSSARTVTLPPFLIDLWRHHLTTHDHPHIFVTSERQLLRRSNFGRRAMRPAADGNHHRTNPAVSVHPVAPGLTFHGLRHSHNTWLIADGIPDVGRARRLGHLLPDKIREIYEHVAPEVEVTILQRLQQRWVDALATLASRATPSTPHCGPRPLSPPAA
ncbi:tyrosine-type recombinase/integrase [Saccharothrix obliqua]|uniref:tyrosine-type recombinase/integrase n=1 Tax=Saccharothrix obliqua TaxID=2861747 RepID=UPI001C5FE5EA|nr:site-specific integrase [Saccharothrix obliqua]MBW4717337.1 site-specific integrase [Saccharothrix obliqua]